jgi:hypothetical protein
MCLLQVLLRLLQSVTLVSDPAAADAFVVPWPIGTYQTLVRWLSHQPSLPSIKSLTEVWPGEGGSGTGCVEGARTGCPGPAIPPPASHVLRIPPHCSRAAGADLAPSIYIWQELTSHLPYMATVHSLIWQELMSHLTYLNASTASRHVFFQASGTTYYGTTYYGTTYYGTTYYGTTYYGTTYHGTTYYGTTYDGTTYYDTTYYGVLQTVDSVFVGLADNLRRRRWHYLLWHYLLWHYLLWHYLPWHDLLWHDLRWHDLL